MSYIYHIHQLPAIVGRVMGLFSCCRLKYNLINLSTSSASLQIECTDCTGI